MMCLIPEFRLLVYYCILESTFHTKIEETKNENLYCRIRLYICIHKPQFL